ncbi:hypothetical protein Tco_1258063, partial [Tanacetum coccineum]
TYDRSSIQRKFELRDLRCNVTGDYIDEYYQEEDVTTRTLIERWCTQTNYQREHTNLDQEQHLSSSLYFDSPLPKFDTTPSDHDSPSVNFIFSPSHHDYNYDWHSSHHENAIESEGQHAFLRTETDSPRRLFYRLFSATPTEDQKVAAKSLRKLSQNKSDANTFFSGGNMTNLNKIVWALVRGDLIPGVEKELVATVHNVCVNVDASRIVENTPELYTALARGLQSQNQNTKENSLLALFRVVAASEENLISFYNQGLLETLLNFYDNNKESARFGETVVRITRNLFNFKPIRESALRSELIGDLTTKLIERVQLEPVTEILLSLLGHEDANDQINQNEVVHILYCVQYEIENPKLKLLILNLIFEIVKQFEYYPEYLNNLRVSEKQYEHLRSLKNDRTKEISKRAKQILLHLGLINDKGQRTYKRSYKCLLIDIWGLGVWENTSWVRIFCIQALVQALLVLVLFLSVWFWVSGSGFWECNKVFIIDKGFKVLWIDEASSGYIAQFGILSSGYSKFSVEYMVSGSVGFCDSVVFWVYGFSKVVHSSDIDSGSLGHGYIFYSLGMGQFKGAGTDFWECNKVYIIDKGLRLIWTDISYSGKVFLFDNIDSGMSEIGKVSLHSKCSGGSKCERKVMWKSIQDLYKKFMVILLEKYKWSKKTLQEIVLSFVIIVFDMIVVCIKAWGLSKF